MGPLEIQSWCDLGEESKWVNKITEKEAKEVGLNKTHKDQNLKKN